MLQGRRIKYLVACWVPCDPPFALALLARLQRAKMALALLTVAPLSTVTNNSVKTSCRETDKCWKIVERIFFIYWSSKNEGTKGPRIRFWRIFFLLFFESCFFYGTNGTAGYGTTVANSESDEKLIEKFSFFFVERLNDVEGFLFGDQKCFCFWESVGTRYKCVLLWVTAYWYWGFFRECFLR